jgi:hypothetical protein
VHPGSRPHATAKPDVTVLDGPHRCGQPQPVAGRLVAQRHPTDPASPHSGDNGGSVPLPGDGQGSHACPKSHGHRYSRQAAGSVPNARCLRNGADGHAEAGGDASADSHGDQSTLAAVHTFVAVLD